jgi:hypothetical protein
MRASQVAAVVGTEADLGWITTLTKHRVESVAANARASAFYLRKRLATS